MSETQTGSLVETISPVEETTTVENEDPNKPSTDCDANAAPKTTEEVKQEEINQNVIIPETANSVPDVVPNSVASEEPTKIIVNVISPNKEAEKINDDSKQDHQNVIISESTSDKEKVTVNEDVIANDNTEEPSKITENVISPPVNEESKDDPKQEQNVIISESNSPGKENIAEDAISKNSEEPEKITENVISTPTVNPEPSDKITENSPPSIALNPEENAIIAESSSGLEKKTTEIANAPVANSVESEADNKTEVETEPKPKEKIVDLGEDRLIKSDTECAKLEVDPVTDNEESDSDDEGKLTIFLDLDSEIEEETCSRTRPFVRRSHSPHSNDVVKSDQISKIGDSEGVPYLPLKRESLCNVNVISVENEKVSISTSDEVSCESVKKSPQTESSLSLPVISSSSSAKERSIDRHESLEKKDFEVEETQAPRTNDTSSAALSNAQLPQTIPLSDHVTKVPLPDHKDKRLASPKHLSLGNSHPVTIPCESESSKKRHVSTTSCHITPTANPVTNTGESFPTNSRRGSKIPVGIAVAWQRLVTTACSSSGMQNSTTTTTICNNVPSTAAKKEEKKHHHQKPEYPPISSSPVKVPLRPSSASPVGIMKSSFNKEKDHHDKMEKRGSVNNSASCSSDVGKHGRSALTPDLVRSATGSSVASVALGASRPLPSSSVPPNLGLTSSQSYLHPSLLDYHYGMRSLSPFSASSGYPPTSWQSGIGSSDLSVPQGFPSSYLQQTMHNHQIQLQQQQLQQYGYNSLSPYLHHPGYETALRRHYEQLILQNHHQQQQHSVELLRQFHQHHQQQLLNSSGGSGVVGGYDSRVPPTSLAIAGGGSPRISIPILSPSPTTGRVRTPTPTTTSLLHPSQTNSSLNLNSLPALSPGTNWPAELYHHNSSTALLSPKSLTSSSPSPVTVQHHQDNNTSDRFNNTIGGTLSSSRKCASTAPLNPGKSFIGDNDTTTQVRKKHPSMSTDKHVDDDKKPQNHPIENSPVLKKRGKSPSSDYKLDSTKNSLTLLKEDENEVKKSKKVESRSGEETLPMSPSSSNSQQNSYKHDFRRMESLIENRNDDEFGGKGERKDSCDIKKSCDDKEQGMTASATNTTMVKGRIPEVKVETDDNLLNYSKNKISLVDLDLKEQNGMKIVKSEPVDALKATTVASLDSPVKKPKKSAGSPKKLGKVKILLNKDEIAKVKVCKKRKANNNEDGEITENKSTLEKVPTKKARKSNKTTTDVDSAAETKSKPKGKAKINIENNVIDKPKKKQSKKKLEETNRRISSCDEDTLLVKGKKANPRNCEDYKRNEIVPESNLPVANTSTVNSYSTIKSNLKPKLGKLQGLSKEKGEKVLLGISRPDKPKRVYKPKIASKVKFTEAVVESEIKPKAKRVKKEKQDTPKVAKKNAKKSDNNPLNKSGGESNPKNPGSFIPTANQNYAIGGDNKPTPMMLSSAAPTIGGPGTTTVIFTTSQPSTQFNHPSNSISLNPVTLSTANVNPMIPYNQNSPVTLILPRLLPQTISNSQTSFKLVVSSQEIKLPFLQNPCIGSNNTIIEGTTQTLQVCQELQNSFLSNATNLQVNNNSSMASSSIVSASASISSGSSVLVTPCDTDIKSNTLTFMRDVTHPNQKLSNNNHPLQIITTQQNQPSNSSYQVNRQQSSNNYNPSNMPNSQQQMTKTISSNHHLQEPNNHHQHHQNVFIRKDFFQPEDNSLDLLATVAQEFGSRDDLGKLVSASNSSRGSSLMTSPVMSMQSPTTEAASHFLTPSSSSCNTTASSISLPSSPLNKSNKSPYDEYEYDEMKEQGNELSQGSYKHPVWLKIPQIVPQAANKAAEKQEKARRKQEKADKKAAEIGMDNKTQRKSVNPKKGKRYNGEAFDLTSTHQQTKEKVTKKDKVEGKKRNNHKYENGGVVDLSKSATLKIPTIGSLEKVQKNPPNRPNKKQIKEKHHSNDNESLGLKMTLPVPKIAKIRIKLSETEEPTLLQQQQNRSSTTTSQPTSESNRDILSTSVISSDSSSVCTKQVKRRHSDGDGVKAKKKHPHNNRNHDDKSLDTAHKKRISQNYAGERKPKNIQQDTSLSPTSKTIKKNKNLSTKTTTTFGTFVKTEEKTKSATEDLLHSSFTSLTPPPTAKPIDRNQQRSMFSPSNLEIDSGSSSNWVQDPTFAASAIRMSDFNQNTKIVEESDANSGNIVVKKEKRKSSDKSSNKIKLSLLNQQDIYSDDKDVKSDLKSFVPYNASKRVSSSNSKSVSPQQTRQQIKPCLKPEPIVRPLKLEDEVNNHSDTEIDLEVATLTNSITPHRTGKSLLQQYRDNRRHQSQQETTTNNESSKGQNQSSLRNDGRMNPPAATKSPITKHHHFGRRLSLNLETGRTREEIDSSEEDEELPDIGRKGEDYYPTNESKQSQKGNNSSKHETDLGRGLPRKRSTRSLTADRVGSFSSSLLAKSTEADDDVTKLPGKIELESVEDLLDEMRILTEIQGLFFTGKLNALQPPDVYGVTLDNERGAQPHLIFSAEEVLEKCIREKKPRTVKVGMKVCAYWSPQYRGLYPGTVVNQGTAKGKSRSRLSSLDHAGRVSTDFNPSFDPEKDLIPIEFDDGDTGMIKLAEIRLLPSNHPVREYDPNPLLTLEKKHRKRRHSSANTKSEGCTGDHEEADCGESYCAKVAKLDEEEGDDEDDEEMKDSHHSFKSLYWTWTGLGFKGKRTKSKKNRNKEFFRGIQRGDEIINVGDSAIFISHGNERPYIGRIEKFWEKKGQKIVNVRWFYHPEEVKSPKRIPHLKHPGALFESPHIDENDVQTIAKKCDVLPFPEFKEKIGRMPKLSLKNSTTKPSKPKDLYYVAGYYDPYTYNLQLKI